MRISCCDNLRSAIACKFLIDATHVGVALPVYEDTVNKIVPLHFCPWCRSKLTSKEERPPVTAYPK